MMVGAPRVSDYLSQTYLTRLLMLGLGCALWCASLWSSHSVVLGQELRGTEFHYHLGSRPILVSSSESPLVMIGDRESAWIEPATAVPAMLMGATPTRWPVTFPLGSLPSTLVGAQGLGLVDLADKASVQERDGLVISASRAKSQFDGSYPGWDLLQGASIWYEDEWLSRTDHSRSNWDPLAWFRLQWDVARGAPRIKAIAYRGQSVREVRASLLELSLSERFFQDDLSEFWIDVNRPESGVLELRSLVGAPREGHSPAVAIQVGLGQVEYVVSDEWAWLFSVKRLEYRVSDGEPGWTELRRWYSAGGVACDFFRFDPAGRLLTSLRVSPRGDVSRTDFDIRLDANGLATGVTTHYMEQSLASEDSLAGLNPVTIGFARDVDWFSDTRSRRVSLYEGGLALGYSYGLPDRTSCGVVRTGDLDSGWVFKNVDGDPAYLVKKESYYGTSDPAK